MKNLTALTSVILFVGCVNAIQGKTQDRGKTPDKVTQAVLASFGEKTVIVRPWSALKDVSEFKNKKNPIVLKGKPGIYVLLDRDYWALRSEDYSSYILNPKDGQSALNIFIGDEGSFSPDKDLMKEPGFTEIKREEGHIADKKVIWRRWSDKHHLYSDCTVYLPAKNDIGNEQYKVRLTITANSIERRAELENNLSSLILGFPSSKSGKN